MLITFYSNRQWIMGNGHTRPYFFQQIDPLTGNFTQVDVPGYSPAALVMIDFTWRLAGVREEHDELEWKLRPATPPAGKHASLCNSAEATLRAWPTAGKPRLCTWMASLSAASSPVRAALVAGKQGQPKLL
jgi:hypothetical protein